MIDLEQQNRIQNQYVSPAGRSLYRHVMGDGSDHIHYGLYAHPKTSMIEALTGSSKRLLELALTRINRVDLKDILDLGAGAGGPAKCLLEWTNATLTCVDIGEQPMKDLESWAIQENLSSRLRTFIGSFEDLPPHWNSRFELVWSQDALCHASNRALVFSEVRRMLRTGGVFVFSDIFIAQNASQEHAKPFTSVNVVQNLGTPQEYVHGLHQAGFTDIYCEDWTSHLPANFLRMRQQIDRLRSEMLRDGVLEEQVDTFAESLEQRLRWPTGAVLNWRAYLCSVK